MESFLKNHLSWFHCLWDMIWPPPPGPPKPPEFIVPPVTTGPQADIVVALYKFNARNTDELSIQEGEQICRISNEGDYIMARKLTGNMEVGLVPANYVTFYPPSAPVVCPTAIDEPSYMESVSRSEAEQLLLSPQNKSGSYLVRPSDSHHGLYSLSVRHEETVNHFLIRQNDRGEYYVNEDKVFPTIPELILFHKANWKLLKSRLLQPCIQQSLITEGSWERPRCEFKLISKIGEGNFGEVWEGLWNDIKRVAIKTFKQENIQSEFEKEISALKNLSHPNLIQLCAVCSSGEPFFIVMEFMPKGNLNNYLKSEEGARLNHDDFMHIVCQVADGMVYLETKHLVHRDLATRNVLVGDNLVCKIADFGLARLLKEDVYSPQGSYTVAVKWTAPEALTHSKYSTKSDVWSFGILIYEVFTLGQPPYPGMTNQEAMAKIKVGYRLPQPTQCSREMYNLMLECWKTKPQDRPSFKDLARKLYVMNHSSR
ncbi:tyrosine-protein kinase Srms [Spea bombifrons]|uniref:tyrosine-protein kinase Srms n=1 Tax=Spea bombifrons TaxID=233779 RepID=UPI0023491D08|nr:tyrosine-protein kinase Srms [Spea bombifrons]